MAQQELQIYLAAVYTNSYMPGGNRYPKLTEAEQGIMSQVKQHNILESYHYVAKTSYVNYMRDNGASVFLDSGAFSAHSLGVTIDLPTYCRYIQENEDIIRKEDGVLMASVLDGIGDAQLTLDNQNAMEKLGVKPLPCFHYGEDERYLEHYLANYEYITIGGMVGKSKVQLKTWLDRIWSKYMVDGAGNPKVRAHGFGITTNQIMEDYPWYSCDSSSWIQAAAFGSIVHPLHNAISVSEKSPSRKDKGRHLATFSEQEQAQIDYDLNYLGFNAERLGNVYESRACFNLFAYMQIQNIINSKKAYQPEPDCLDLFNV